MSDDVLLRVDGVSKKFCRSFKKSLWYGVKDSASGLAGRPVSDGLRPDEFWAVKDVSFDLRAGASLGLIGRNGAGKTTLLKMINGLFQPDKGRIEIRGRVGGLIALGAGFNPILTGRENIYVAGAVLGLSKRQIEEKIDEIIDFAEVREFIDMPVQSYSSGMAVRLGFSVAAAIRPDILLLDEVLAVGDAGFQAKCFNTLADFRKKGTVFILVSHNMHIISRYCDRVIFMSDGAIKFEGPAEHAISKYNADCGEASDRQDPDSNLRGTQSGSGKIKILNVHFTNHSGDRIESIGAGEGAILIIEFRRNNSGACQPLIDVVIRDGEREIFQGTNEAGQGDLGKIPGQGRIKVRFDALPINVNRLDCFVAILDRDTKELFDWIRDVPLKVKPTSTRLGSLVLKPKWSLSPLAHRE